VDSKRQKHVSKDGEWVHEFGQKGKDMYPGKKQKYQSWLIAKSNLTRRTVHYLFREENEFCGFLRGLRKKRKERR
jgi:hypothetical protein